MTVSTLLAHNICTHTYSRTLAHAHTRKFHSHNGAILFIYESLELTVFVYSVSLFVCVFVFSIVLPIRWLLFQFLLLEAQFIGCFFFERNVCISTILPQKIFLLSTREKNQKKMIQNGPNNNTIPNVHWTYDKDLQC